MPYVDAFLFNKKGLKKNLVLELEEDESILTCIKQGMEQNNLEQVNVETIEGRMKECLINYFERNSFKSSVLKDVDILIASGSFKSSYSELFGSMKIVTNEKPPMQGTFVRGKASEGLKITLSFIEFVDKEEPLIEE
ncbi:MAG: hypothetical protein COV47_04695 [Candidatus Diapherotrites archaeon CG11_big_fil_rev_8_21_14_0_20_37_9]|nr:MAG: hypothetical protein COV47_04695 [Candidatus Diapherotrites archaeon CG11_big_fil_rev_8_21_14_0_20_37_9]